MNHVDRVAQHTRFDLSFLYKDIHDPRLQDDVQTCSLRAASFARAYKGTVSGNLSVALGEYEQLEMQLHKVHVYIGLRRMLDVTDTAVQAMSASIERQLSRVEGEHLSFFPIEVGVLPASLLSELYTKDAALLRYKPWIERQRLYAPHRLDDRVESALIKRDPFGPSSWGSFFEEVATDLRFIYRSHTYGLEEMLSMIAESQSASLRSCALKVLNDGLAGPFEKYMAQALYMTVGSHALEIAERGYRHPMEPAQKDNMLDGATVDALHNAVMVYMVPIARRFYRLKAKMLGLRRLAWSDRNAPVIAHRETYVPFEKARDIVTEAYHSFSPVLGELVEGMFEKKMVDAAVLRHKQSGAFNWSAVLPDHGPTSFVFLQYFGTSRSIMTLAHELGHAVHGLLVGETHGSLSGHVPLAYAETASVFGERLVFESLAMEHRLAGDDEGYVSLLCAKIDDMMNTVLRQISFSNFERRLHGMNDRYTTWGEPVKRSAQELSLLWMDVVRECYGPSGDIFSYENAERLWSYISHFHRPFYVYSYACGELLTHSLYAKRSTLSKTFPSLYVDVLRAGGTTDIKTLLQPFAIDPTGVGFWKQGIMSGIESMVAEAEDRARSLLKKRRR